MNFQLFTFLVKLVALLRNAAQIFSSQESVASHLPSSASKGLSFKGTCWVEGISMSQMNGGDQPSKYTKFTSTALPTALSFQRGIRDICSGHVCIVQGTVARAQLASTRPFWASVWLWLPSLGLGGCRLQHVYGMDLCGHLKMRLLCSQPLHQLHTSQDWCDHVLGDKAIGEGFLSCFPFAFPGDLILSIIIVGTSLLRITMDKLRSLCDDLRMRRIQSSNSCHEEPAAHDRFVRCDGKSL